MFGSHGYHAHLPMIVAMPIAQSQLYMHFRNKENFAAVLEGGGVLPRFLTECERARFEPRAALAKPPSHCSLSGRDPQRRASSSSIVGFRAQARKGAPRHSAASCRATPTRGVRRVYRFADAAVAAQCLVGAATRPVHVLSSGPSSGSSHRSGAQRGDYNMRALKAN